MSKRIQPEEMVSLIADTSEVMDCCYRVGEILGCGKTRAYTIIRPFLEEKLDTKLPASFPRLRARLEGRLKLRPGKAPKSKIKSAFL